MMDVDFIVPWVDGSDTAWQRSFNQYAPLDAQITDKRAERYRDWGLLRYWFRGVECFAPWVRKIHFITCGQCPEWLNLQSPKLHWVQHSDYIPEKYLPVFNVNPIELMMHRIEGLSEHFVYFNDDLFLLRPIAIDRFFRNGLPCDTAVCNMLTPSAQGVMTHIMANNMALINECFDKHQAIRQNWRKWFNPVYGMQQLRTLLLWAWPHFSIMYEHHLPTAFLKSTFEEIWALYAPLLEDTSMTRFREITNCSQWLMRDWQLAKGTFTPINVSKDGSSMMLGTDDLQQIVNIITRQQKSILCINDGSIKAEQVPQIQEALVQAFETILPHKSSFEI
ncbi:MAG: Stealth CR1 domain-containing protein [Paludibacter sp.]|nr:Stealth CR1 domain-containing protein [Bacteroidales bacterium]MCM1069884.1 Stealth CR1 domain-containing protein [Prevotella sp.]MCM1354565.1 Stealth CR1 domain-containing protein [Bacteroides sp.]MCM1443460.1 Stealth CR1 domain-containing protein [Muribaculum sp.]MCM1482544.1 Stealth CR1 domain-containing protein [Paludibacter sp.]